MSPAREVVITGLGIICPIGIGTNAVWNSLCARQSGVRPLTCFDTSGAFLHFGAEVLNFDPKEYVKPRKSLKVMSRDIQFGVAAADMARTDAGLTDVQLDPERFGVVFGADLMHCQLEDVENAFRRCTVEGRFDFELWGKYAMEEVFPLWMLKYLPNMPACHIAIAHDARGPNNSHSLAEASSLIAMSEACRIIERGHADVMITGGACSRIHPTLWVRSSLLPVSRRNDDPQHASRPFDADRDGFVNGEGAAAFVLETREHALARGAKILASIRGFGNSFEARENGRPLEGAATRRAIAAAMRMADFTPRDIGHVNAHGLSTIDDDRAEARAIRAELADVPVTAPKSYFGSLGAAAGAVEMVVSLLAFEHGQTPVTLNYERADPECQVNVIHGEPLGGRPATALLLNQAPMGQSAALVIAGE
ncbi:MAG TPA: beta-ketoacyl-[acyl-carrier-protein] synthase family protein [Pirellulales bacterium]|nr:beta-ketoacyl-[acyl-carrier-protein] synthase family protein [Pirellulales bacterium]